MDLRATVGQLVERTENHSRQISEIQSDVKRTKAVIERFGRSSIVGIWFLIAAILNWDPQKIATFLSAIHALK